MARLASDSLRRLALLYDRYEEGSGDEKRAHLSALAGARLDQADDVLRLHEILCWLQAYPDDAALLAAVDGMLGAFHERVDLLRHRNALRDSGIAGTELAFPFFARAASRLARRWPERLRVDWASFEGAKRLERILPMLTLFGERAAFDEPLVSARAWLRRFCGPEGEAAFLVRRWSALAMDPFARDTLYDDLDPALRFALGPETPSRTRARSSIAPRAFQTTPLARERPDLRQVVMQRPRSVALLGRRDGARLVELAQDAMLPRQRDLEVFAHGNPDDVRLVDCGDGLSFACIGCLPERRSLLEAVVGFLTLKNGVPIGYALCTALFASSEVAYNVFETFRGGEAALVFGRLLAAIRHLFGSTSFAIDPYQLGHGNEEGIASGAFWFYQKLGFAPRDPEVLGVLGTELGHMRRHRGHRSSRATLRKLARRYVFWQLRKRHDVLGAISLPHVALALSRRLSEQYGVDRELALRDCRRVAAERLGIAGLSAAEREAWDRWAPLIAAIPEVQRWTRGERRALLDVVRAKGGGSEIDYVALFDRHTKLRRAVRRLASSAVRTPASG